ncbi:hypothetical protein GCM10009727_00180 [Actinomadura napierensis]|uniref:Uncharacterized protein n=1 Tax=Actinomadura napierensis TaxID=267854 RepID=A0ABN2XV41_9ACTN
MRRHGNSRSDPVSQLHHAQGFENDPQIPAQNAGVLMALGITVTDEELRQHPLRRANEFSDPPIRSERMQRRTSQQVVNIPGPQNPGRRPLVESTFTQTGNKTGNGMGDIR